MKCKIVVLLLPLIGFIPIALADDPPPGNEATPTAPIITDYERQVSARTDPELRALSAIEAFSPLDGAVLIDDLIGENRWIVIWNAELGGVQVARNYETLELTLFYDAYGRPAFASSDVSGWIDVADGYLHAEIAWPEQDKREYVGLLPVEGEMTQRVPLLATAENTKKCVCKGTLERWDCTDADCDDGQACNHNGTNSKCIWSAVPVGSMTP